MVPTVTTASNKPSSTNLQAPVFIDKPGRLSPRPSFTSNRPSWIGPQHEARSLASGSSNMAQKEEIQYSHPGLQPPVFIAGSMCKPQWEPIEMKYTEKDDGELEFEHEFEAEPGEYQYKFRLGPGDWWVLDETKPTGEAEASLQVKASITNGCTLVDDGTGIRNNLLVVEPRPQQPQITKPHEAEVQQTSQEKDVPMSIQVTDTQDKHAELVDDLDDDDDIPESEKNLFRHETVQIPEGTGESDKEDEDVEDDDEQVEEPPLFEHEVGPRVDSQFGTPSKTNNFSFDNVTESPVEVDDPADDERDAPCPLFRHETGTSHDTDPDEAPLFAHESMSPVMSATPFSPSSRKQRKPDLEDVNDPSLEPFPVDEAGIQARIQRVATRHREDEVVFEGTPPSPSLAQTKSFSPQAQPDLTRIESSDLSHLDAIDETEETDEPDDVPAEKLAEKKDSLVQPVPINIQVRDVSEVDNNPAFTEVPDVSSRGPPTPPMTPTEHVTAKAAPHDGASDSKEAPVPVASPRSREDNATDHISNRPAPSEASKAVKPSKRDDVELSFASKACIWFIGLCGGKMRAA
ncbi:unnamed protein product [Aureobasidium mustum]|uniref:AMP-activated protein kinase glycogen-binding domain-containing protein n=1 Tax=Aureobasidium mustum TaxID=2773714 RepID=A0A9N8K7F1_9PEZI|nr:unnamed protein product [Aureobasidium mustum]